MSNHLGSVEEQYLKEVKQLPNPEGAAYFLVVCQEGAYPELQSGMTLGAVVQRLKELRAEETDAQLYIFRGEQLLLSKGPLHYLLVPGQEPVPLFDAEPNLEPDPAQNFSGWVPPTTPLIEQPAPTNANTLSMPADDDWGDWGFGQEATDTS